MDSKSSHPSLSQPSVFFAAVGLLSLFGAVDGTSSGSSHPSLSHPSDFVAATFGSFLAIGLMTISLFFGVTLGSSHSSAHSSPHLEPEVVVGSADYSKLI